MAQKKVNFLITAKDNASKHFRKLNSTLKAVNKSIKPVVGGLKTFAKVTGVATGALVLIGRQSFKFMDTLDKVSRKIGVSTEFLQKLRFAGTQTGVDVRKLDMGLQRFARRVDEARNNTGEAMGALKELGIQFNTSTGTAKTTEQIFMDVAKQMANMEDGGRKLRLGFKLFDSEGVAVVNTMTELNKQFSIFEDLGLGIPQEAIDKSVSFRDNLNEVNNIVQQISNLTFAGLADELDEITTLIKDELMEQVGKAGGADNLADVLGEQLKTIISVVVSGLQDFLNLMRGLINSLATALQNLSDKFNLGLDIFGEGKQREQLAEAKRTLDSLIASRNELAGATLRKGSGFLNFGDPQKLEETNNLITLQKQKIKDLQSQMGEPLLIKGEFTFADVLKGILFPDDDPFLRDIEDAIDGTGIFERKEKKEPVFALDIVSGSLASLQGEISTTEQMLADGLVDTIKGANDAFVDFFMGSADGFKSLAEDIKRNFIDFIVREFITSGLIDFISGMFGDNSFMTRAVSKSLGFAPKERSTGGPLVAGQTALVGERGPEIITASQDMMVKPTNQTAGLTPGGATINFNINAMDTQGFDELLTARKNQIIAMVDQGLNQRGGSLI